MNTPIEVVLELEGKPILVGTLWTRRKQGREGASFAYSDHWLQHFLPTGVGLVNPFRCD